MFFFIFFSGICPPPNLPTHPLVEIYTIFFIFFESIPKGIGLSAPNSFLFYVCGGSH